MKENLLGKTVTELEALATSMGEFRFRGRQLYVAMYRKRVFDLDQMTDQSKNFRRRLAESHEVRSPQLDRKFVSSDGTIRMLFRLDDGKFAEAVSIPERRRHTICISSQVGCGVDCTFCMTARLGFVRNLTPDEIIGQILTAQHEGMLPERGVNVVLMGMGEPLHNYRNVVTAIEVMSDPDGMAIPLRKITLSTAGVVPLMKRLFTEKAIPNLAVSLNAPNEELRSELMPINERWSLQELLDTCRQLPLRHRQRITFEYVLIGNLNDAPSHAAQLARHLEGLRCRVNLIPWNPAPEIPYSAPTPEAVDLFQRVLRENGVMAFLRKPRGQDISAACGQLATRAAGGNDAPPLEHLRTA